VRQGQGKGWCELHTDSGDICNKKASQTCKALLRNEILRLIKQAHGVCPTLLPQDNKM
jgi:hypothetical protein